jgi:hypothetical protein
MSDVERQKLERRAFLEQCGRFAVVTPPVVSLMLTTGTKAALAASGKTTLTTTATTIATASTTATATTTATTTSAFTTTAVTSTTVTSDFTITTITTVTNTMFPSTSTATLFLQLVPGGSEHSELAMMIDSMGVMKLN